MVLERSRSMQMRFDHFMGFQFRRLSLIAEHKSETKGRNEKRSEPGGVNQFVQCFFFFLFLSLAKCRRARRVMERIKIGLAKQNKVQNMAQNQSKRNFCYCKQQNQPNLEQVKLTNGTSSPKPLPPGW